MKAVRVHWVDSVSDGGWIGRNEAIQRAGEADVLRTTSVGYLLAETKDYTLLATSYMRDGDLVQGVLQIPGEAMRRMDLLADDDDAGPVSNIPHNQDEQEGHNEA